MPARKKRGPMQLVVSARAPDHRKQAHVFQVLPTSLAFECCLMYYMCLVVVPSPASRARVQVQPSPTHPPRCGGLASLGCGYLLRMLSHLPCVVSFPASVFRFSHLPLRSCLSLHRSCACALLPRCLGIVVASLQVHTSPPLQSGIPPAAAAVESTAKGTHQPQDCRRSHRSLLAFTLQPFLVVSACDCHGGWDGEGVLVMTNVPCCAGQRQR